MSDYERHYLVAHMYGAVILAAQSYICIIAAFALAMFHVVRAIRAIRAKP